MNSTKMEPESWRLAKKNMPFCNQHLSSLGDACDNYSVRFLFLADRCETWCGPLLSSWRFDMLLILRCFSANHGL